MKLVFFDDFKLGAVKGDNVVDLSDAANHIPHVSPQDILSGLIADFDTHKPHLEEAISASDGVPLSSVRLRSPAPGLPAPLQTGLPGAQVALAAHRFRHGE